MERIGLHNYEAYFLDHLEGSLNAQQEFELFDFLEKHPDLKAELDLDLDELNLEPVAAASVMDLDSLKVTGIQPGEVEDLMIASVENQLNTKQEDELEQYVLQNDLSKELVYYRSTVLQPDLSIVHPNKKNLKKGGLVIPLTYRFAAAAAAIALLIGLNVDFGDNTVNGTNDSSLSASEFIQSPKNSINFANQKDWNNSNETVDFNQQNPQFDQPNRNDYVEKDDNIDTASQVPVLIPDGGDQIVQQKDIIPIDDPKDNDPPKELKDPKEKIIDKKTWEENQIADNGIVREEPIKLITNFAGNVLNKDVSYTRDKNKKSNDYVAHHFKLGKFEFQRKKH